MEQNFNGGGGSSTNISQSQTRQHNSDFMYIQRQHQILSPKAAPGDIGSILDQSQGSHQLGLMPFKQFSEPISNIQSNFGGNIKYQVANQGGAPIFTERSSIFSQGTPQNNATNGGITQYTRPKTNSPFPPFGAAGATAQSTRSAQKTSVSQNPLHQLGPFAPLSGDQLQDSSNSVPLVTQVPILTFPNMDQIESEEGGNPLLLRRQHFNSRGSRVHPQNQLQPQLSDLLNSYSTSGGDNLSTNGGAIQSSSQGVNPQNQSSQGQAPQRSFHHRHQSRDILRIQGGANSQQQIQSHLNDGQHQYMGNFNIGGTWTSSSLIMSGPLNSNIPNGQGMMPLNALSEAQSQNNTFHQLNDTYGESGRQSPKTSEQNRNPYINEINYSEQDQQNLHQSYGYHRGLYNSETKPQRRPQPEVQIPPALNPQFQQSQQVFMQNNFFIQQMLASPPSNTQIQNQGGIHQANAHKNFPPNNQPMPAFDASLSGLQGGTSNAFFDLMEMSSVLSSSGLVGGDPLVDSTGSGSHHHPKNSGIFQSVPFINMMQQNMIANTNGVNFVMNQDLSKEQLRIQVPKDISSRQSTQSRVRMNRLNKMMAGSASQQPATQNAQNQNDMNQEMMNEISNLQSTIQGGVLGQSFAHSYQSETSSQQSRQPIWMKKNHHDQSPESDTQNLQLQSRQKLTVLNQSYRDLHQAELLSQSMIANTKLQLTPQQQAQQNSNQISRVQIGDFQQQQQIVPQPDFNLMVKSNRNISGSRRQLQIIPSTQNESSGYDQQSSQQKYLNNEKAAQSMILDSQEEQLLIQPILAHHHSAQEAQNSYVDESAYQSAGGVSGAASRESSQSNRQSTFCIEMGKAKPKILKNSLSSAYQVFMPISTKAGSRRGNLRVFQGNEVQTSQGSRKNLEPMTQQNSPKRHGSKLKQSSNHRDSLASHSQRANEFSPTNPSYYITFNQDSHIEHHKFNPVPNLIGTTGDLVGVPSAPRHRQQQQSISSNQPFEHEARQTRRQYLNGGSKNTGQQRSESKNSSHSKSRGELGATQSNNFLIKTRPNIRRVEVPSQPTSTTPLTGECETPEEQEIVVKSANIIGINRKIKINRIVNRNQQPLTGANTNVPEPTTDDKQQPQIPQAIVSRRNFMTDQVTKAAQQRSRMPSFDGVASSSKRSEDLHQNVFLQEHHHEPSHPPTEPPGSCLRSPQRHNQSQIIEPLSKAHFSTNRLGVNSNGGGSQNNLAAIAGGHQRRQSQQVAPPTNATQKQMLLPPRHRSQQKINFTNRQEGQSSAERKIGSQGWAGNAIKPQEMNGTFSLLQQNTNHIRLASQEQPINLTGAFPSIIKQASQTKFDFPGTGETLGGNQMPLDRTASFQPPVVDKSLTSNSSTASLHHRRSSRGFQGLLHASQQQQPPQLMLASTYELSSGPADPNVKQLSIFSPQGRTGSMMRKRRVIPQTNSNSREASRDYRQQEGHGERSTSNRRSQGPDQTKESPPSTTTFSQLVLSQQRPEDVQVHSQSSPPLATLDSQKNNPTHYETPRIGAAALRQQPPRNSKEHHSKVIQQANTTSGCSPVRQQEPQPYRRLNRQ